MNDGMDDLLGDFGSAPANVAQNPSIGGLDDLFGDSNSTSMIAPSKSAMAVTSTSSLPKHTLLNHVKTRGLGIEYQFVRPLAGQGNVNVVNLFLKNHSNMTIQSIKVSKEVEGSGMSMVPFAPISSLAAFSETQATINLDFNQKNSAARFEISDCNGQHEAVLHPQVGELFKPHEIDIDTFKTLQAKLQGMQKTSGQAKANGAFSIANLVSDFANIAPVSQDEEGLYCFAGQTLKDSKPLLLVVNETGDNAYSFDIHLENAILGNALSAEFAKAIALK